MSMFSKALKSVSASGAFKSPLVAGAVGVGVGLVGGPIAGALAAKAAGWPARLANKAALNAVAKANASGLPVGAAETMGGSGAGYGGAGGVGGGGMGTAIAGVARRVAGSSAARQIGNELVSGVASRIGGRRTYLARVLSAADIARSADGSPYLQRRVFQAAMPKRHRGLSYSDLRGFRKTMRLLKSVGRKAR